MLAPQPDLSIVCFYADLGRPYLHLMARMTASAKRVMPLAETVLITPTPAPEIGGLFDTVVDVSRHLKTTDKTVCFDRACATVSWQRLAERRTVYTDPDIEFHRPVEFDGSFDVGLLWRKRKADQPVNTGIVLAEPGCSEFWRTYGSVAANLPTALRSWWCDQLAYTVMLGIMHSAGDTVQAFDARVKLFEMTDHCTPREKATTDNPWAWHDKGKRKWTDEELVAMRARNDISPGHVMHREVA